MAAYFWVGGTGTWSGTGNTQFALTSGGVATILNPTNADTVTFDANSGTAATVTCTATAVSLDTTINKSDITILLSGSPTLCTGLCTLTAGTLNLNNFVLSTGRFNSSNANVRTITTGTGSFTVTGNAATIWTTGNATNLTYTSGFPTVNATYSGSVGTRVFNIGGTADRINLNITAGSDIIAPASTFIVNNYNFTGFSGTLTNVASIIFGSLTLSSTMTVSAGANTFEFRATSGITPITSAGKTMDFPILFNGTGTVFQLQDALTSGVTRTVTLNAGTLSLVSYTLTSGLFVCGSSASNTLDFGTGNIALSGTGTIFTGSTTTTVTGTPQVICTDNSATARTITPGVVTETDSISFRITAGTGTLALTAGSYRDLDFTDGVNPTGFQGSLTMAVLTIYGNFKASTGMTCPASGNTTTFAATSGTKTINTAGVVFDRPFTFNGAGGTFQLASALTSGSTRSCTLTNGTLDLAGFTLTTGFFVSSNTNVRAVTSGAGSFTLTGNNATLWQTGTATNLTYTTIPTVNATYSGATGTRTFSVASALDRINLNITAGTDTISNTPTFAVNNYNFTGFAGTLANIATNIYGNLTLSTGMTVSAGGNAFTFFATSGTKTITSNGKTMDFPVTFNGAGGTFQLQDAMTVGSSRLTTLTNGTLDLNNLTLSTGRFDSSNANTRTLAFGTGKIVISALNATIWNTDTATNFTVTGTSRVEISGAGTGGQTRGIFAGINGGTETNVPNFYVTAGADNVSFLGTNRKYGTIDFSNGGISTFTGNFQSDNFQFTVYGNLILTASVAGFTTSSSFDGPIIFGSTSGTKSVTSAGKTYPVPLTFNGVGGTWLCADALTLSSTLTLTNGTLQSGTYLITSATFTSTGAGVRNLSLNGGSINPIGAGTAWTTSGTNFSMGATDIILLNSASAQTLSGGGVSLGTINIANASVKTITGNNTIFNIVNTVFPASVTFAAGSTNTFSNFSLNGIAGSLVTLRSTVPGTQYNLVKI